MPNTSLALISSSVASIQPNNIDDILNNPDRSLKGGLLNNPQRSAKGGIGNGVRSLHDFINPVDQVTIPGIPASPEQDLGNIISRGRIPGIPYSSGDKKQYHLFNPTPNHLLRDLAPDRPDATESPITVDAGRYQIEASLFDYRRNRGVETYTYGQVNLKAGLTHNTDLQAVIDLRSETAGDWTTFGDLTLRLKHNFWGNEGGKTALGIMPYLTLPTRSDEWQGGLIVPWATSLTDDLSLGLQGQLDSVDDGTGRETQFLFTAVLGYPIIGNLGGYTEYIGIIGEDRYESYYSGGLTYEINENFVLDTGVQVGLNSQSEDFGFFTGFTKRF